MDLASPKFGGFDFIRNNTLFIQVNQSGNPNNDLGNATLGQKSYWALSKLDFSFTSYL